MFIPFAGGSPRDRSVSQLFSPVCETPVAAIDAFLTDPSQHSDPDHVRKANSLLFYVRHVHIS